MKIQIFCFISILILGVIISSGGPIWLIFVQLFLLGLQFGMLVQLFFNND